MIPSTTVMLMWLRACTSERRRPASPSSRARGPRLPTVRKNIHAESATFAPRHDAIGD